jgi:hypothetical protein
VHLDRPYYALDETIWLKAYLVAGSFHEPSPLSYIIYIELIDQLEKVVQTTRLLADHLLQEVTFRSPILYLLAIIQFVPILNR